MEIATSHFQAATIRKRQARPIEGSISFTAQMVMALLQDRKGQTRRIVTPSLDDSDHGSGFSIGVYNPTVIDRKGHEQPGPETFGIYDNWGEWSIKCPYGPPGSTLSVKEAYRFQAGLDGLSPAEIGDAAVTTGLQQRSVPVRYEADRSTRSWIDGTHTPGKYRHARFMPRWASRTTLEIVGIRVERLQDISEADAVAEGVEPRIIGGGWREYGLAPADEAAGTPPIKTARDSYRSLWISIHGEQSWNDNPHVWVIEFNKKECNT